MNGLVTSIVGVVAASIRIFLARAASLGYCPVVVRVPSLRVAARARARRSAAFALFSAAGRTKDVFSGSEYLVVLGSGSVSDVRSGSE